MLRGVLRGEVDREDGEGVMIDVSMSEWIPAIRIADHQRIISLLLLPPHLQLKRRGQIRGVAYHYGLIRCFARITTREHKFPLSDITPLEFCLRQ